MQKIVYYYERLVMRTSIVTNRFGKLPAVLQCSWVLVFLLIVIVCNLQFIAKSGDAIHKWFLIRVFLENGTFLPLQPDHHLLRWGLIWPVIAFCKLFGYSIYMFYLYPILCIVQEGLCFFFWHGRFSVSPWRRLPFCCMPFTRSLSMKERNFCRWFLLRSGFC